MFRVLWLSSLSDFFLFWSIGSSHFIVMPPIPVPSSLLSPLALAISPAILCPLSHPYLAGLPKSPSGFMHYPLGEPAEGEAAQGELQGVS